MKNIFYLKVMAFVIFISFNSHAKTPDSDIDNQKGGSLNSDLSYDTIDVKIILLKEYKAKVIQSSYNLSAAISDRAITYQLILNTPNSTKKGFIHETLKLILALMNKYNNPYVVNLYPFIEHKDLLPYRLLGLDDIPVTVTRNDMSFNQYVNSEEAADLFNDPDKLFQEVKINTYSLIDHILKRNEAVYKIKRAQFELQRLRNFDNNY